MATLCFQSQGGVSKPACIEEAEVLLYRGIGQAILFRCLWFCSQDFYPANRAI